MFYLLLLVGLAFSVALPPPCSLNGVANADGSCNCYSGWGGPACASLKLLPSAPLSASTQTYFFPSNGGSPFVDNSWGISVLPGDDGFTWHGFMTELEGNCSLSAYSITSRILHLTAPSALGPWSVEGVALPAFAHNPQAVRDTDGAWLLFHIGAAQPPGCNPRCAGGKLENATGCASCGKGTSVARASSPFGPWERVPYILPNNETNPSAVVLPNGTILLTARRWEGGVPIYTAPSWRGPYKLLPPAPVVYVGEGTPYAFDEDPFLFSNAGGWHMLTHREPNGEAGTCSPTKPATECRCTGGHSFAVDPIAGPWYVDLQPIYNCTLELEGGPLRLWARQRPTLVMHANETGCPVLYSGASTDPISQYFSSFTMQQQVAC
jgi:hypothetical protein